MLGRELSATIVVDIHPVEKAINSRLWIAVILGGLSNVMCGYGMISLNCCLVMGGNNSPSACYNNDDDGSPPCPPGSIFADLNITTSKCDSYCYVQLCLAH